MALCPLGGGGRACRCSPGLICISSAYRPGTPRRIPSPHLHLIRLRPSDPPAWLQGSFASRLHVICTQPPPHTPPFPPPDLHLICMCPEGRRRCRAVTSRRRDESRCRDAVPGHAGPPRPPRGRPVPPPGARPGDSGSGGSGSGDSGRRPPPFSASFSPGGARGGGAPPTSAREERRLSALCCAASPASGSAGGARCPPPPRAPPGPCPPPCPPPRRRLPPTARLSPRTFHSYLPRSHRTYSCVHCRAHLARHEELISKSFQGSHGRAYLFNSVVNVGCGPAEQRLLLTGLHSVADIFCQSCKTTLGWKYEQAFESSQKYKEGKFIIEMSHMVKENGWD
ncbi:protein yippee-like 4 [Strix aluco]|uniref:protein yippee-like 4 n=1 Tax=Strix aluco TaxID=111821 RepID=UPI003DA608FB